MFGLSKQINFLDFQNFNSTISPLLLVVGVPEHYVDMAT